MSSKQTFQVVLGRRTRAGVEERTVRVQADNSFSARQVVERNHPDWEVLSCERDVTHDVATLAAEAMLRLAPLKYPRLKLGPLTHSAADLASRFADDVRDHVRAGTTNPQAIAQSILETLWNRMKGRETF